MRRQLQVVAALMLVGVGLLVVGLAGNWLSPLIAGICVLAGAVLFRGVVFVQRVFARRTPLAEQEAPPYECPECGYALRGVTGIKCPECGTVRPAPLEGQEPA